MCIPIIKTLRPSYIYNGNPYTRKTVFILKQVPVAEGALF